MNEIVTGDRIATDLVRAALDPVTHRLPVRSALAVCARAALFADLALAGAIGDTGRAPVVTDPVPGDDRLLAAVHRTVADRPGVAWKRWYRHVDVDLAALSAELVDAARWTELGRDVRGDRWADAAPDEALAIGLRARAVGLGEEAPESPREAVLGVLAVSCGAGGGAARPRATVKIGAVLSTFPDFAGVRLQPAHVAVGVAQLLLRRKILRHH